MRLIRARYTALCGREEEKLDKARQLSQVCLLVLLTNLQRLAPPLWTPYMHTASEVT